MVCHIMQAVGTTRRKGGEGRLVREGLHISTGIRLKPLAVHVLKDRTMGESDRVGASAVDHMAIVEVTESRDAGLASQLVREHTMRLHEHVRQHLDETGNPIETARSSGVMPALRGAGTSRREKRDPA